jgi:hypothetical protein
VGGCIDRWQGSSLYRRRITTAPTPEALLDEKILHNVAPVASIREGRLCHPVIGGGVFGLGA